jgi:hypothetical protein
MPAQAWMVAALLFITVVGSASAQGADARPLVLVGGFVERNYSTQPGVRVGRAPPLDRRWQPRLTVSWSTTRLATALGSNALEEDRLQVGADWYFRQARRLSPGVGLSLGYTRFDREDDDLFSLLDNDAPILTLLGGAETRLRSGLRVNARLGYSHLQSSTVYPIVGTVGVDYPLSRGGRR